MAKLRWPLGIVTPEITIVQKVIAIRNQFVLPEFNDGGYRARASAVLCRKNLAGNVIVDCFVRSRMNNDFYWMIFSLQVLRLQNALEEIEDNIEAWRRVNIMNSTLLHW